MAVVATNPGCTSCAGLALHNSIFQSTDTAEQWGAGAAGDDLKNEGVSAGQVSSGEGQSSSIQPLWGLLEVKTDSCRQPRAQQERGFLPVLENTGGNDSSLDSLGLCSLTAAAKEAAL